MRKLVIALTLAAATALPMVLQSTSADAYPVCRIGGHFYQMRCPDRVAARGIDGRAHWYRNPVYCMYPNGAFRHWGHC
jgi:hypothetical protein